MTAEIAILNKSAVALAADSAVSIQQGANIKVYNSMNKLFSLSKHAPIGIMVYGTAQLAGTPWETIIKLYRSQLGTKRFSTVTDYANDFVSYVQSNTKMFPESEQRGYALYRILHAYHHIHHSVSEELSDIAEQKGSVEAREVTQVYAEHIKQMKNDLLEFDNMEGFDENFGNDIVEKYDSAIDALTGEIFENHKFTKRQRESLKEIASMLFYKEILLSSFHSGVVLAGFGEDEIFPSLDSFVMDGIVLDRLRYMRYIKAETTHSMTASIYSFAQSEAVQAFMNGIQPEYAENIDGILEAILTRFPDAAASALPHLSEADRRRLTTRLRAFGSKVLVDVRAAMNKYEREVHSDPIVEAVEVLPRDELASMAETLVNLTSFKQRVSLNYETVGGPIDVAVISKGDGFIWIKRKHYFDPGLNHQFFANYYQRGSGGDMR